MEIEDFDFFEVTEMFVQHVALNVPDKASYKSLACETIEKIFQRMPTKVQKRCCEWLKKLSRNTKTGYRSFSVELCTELIQSFSRKKKWGEEEESMLFDLTMIIIDRMSDAIMTVRSKSLSCMISVFKNARENMEHFLKETILSDKEIDLFGLIRKRVQDTKSSVRKFAMQALEVISLSIKEFKFTSSDIEIFSRLCHDPSLATRRQGIQSITELMMSNPTNQELIKTWLHSVLPRVLDPEQSVQQKAVDVIDECMFQRIVSASKKGSKDQEVWLIVDQLEGDLLKFIQFVCQFLISKKKVPKNLISSLLKCIKVERNVKQSWVLLCELAPHFPESIDAELLLEHWNNNKVPSEDVQYSQLLLKILFHCCSQLEQKDLKGLKERLLEKLYSFDLPVTLIQNYVETVVSICHSIEPNSEKTVKNRISEWTSEIMKIADNTLTKYVLSNSNGNNSNVSVEESIEKINLSEQEITAYLYTAGSVAQVSFGNSPERLTTIVQTLVSPVEGNNEYLVSPHVRAIAFITLGRLCLENEKLAKKYSSVFARELELSQFPIIRNNIIFIMCDLCKKFTGVIEPYVSNIASCLQDTNLVVRKQTLLLLSHLLKQNYLKWKNVLFYRVLLSTIDPCPQIASSAKACLTNISQIKNSTTGQLFFSHFIESIFHFNDFMDHPTYNKFPQTLRDREIFTLKGEKNRENRHKIYQILLSSLDDEQRFQVSAKLCSDILAAVVDEKIAFKSSHELIIDALKILSSKQIKVNSSKKKEIINEEEDQEDTKESNVKEAKGKILSQVKKIFLKPIFFFFFLPL